MSLISRFSTPCPRCHRPERTVYGSQQWHERNDPPGGYCHCDILTRLLDTESQAAPPDAVTCATCQGRKVIGIPGAPCPMCKGAGWDNLATEVQRLNKNTPAGEG